MNEQLRFDRIHSYVNSIQELQNFLINVSLPYLFSQDIKPFRFQSQAVEQSAKKFNIKVIVLWKSFLRRLNDKQFGITYFHLQILKIAIKFTHFKELLSILLQPGLPIFIELNEYKAYLKMLADELIQMKQFEKAYTFLLEASKIQSSTLQLTIQIFQLLILLQKIICQQEMQKITAKYNEINVIYSTQLSQIKSENFQRYNKLIFEYSLLIKISNELQLNQEQLEFLRSKGLLELYKKCNNKKILRLKSYIKKDIKTQNLYRIKCSQINNVQIDDFQVIKQINSHKKLYKVDQRNSIMYFNQKICNQNQINVLLDRSIRMQKILNNRLYDGFIAKRQQISGGYYTYKKDLNRIF